MKQQQVKKGDKIRLIKPMGVFRNVGEVCSVTDITDDGVIIFRVADGFGWGCMSEDELPKYFEAVKANTVTAEHINSILSQAKKDVFTIYDKCTVVTVQLPNGFVMVEYSACVDPANYDKEIGYNACMRKIKDRLWELEGYKLQCEMAAEQ